VKGLVGLFLECRVSSLEGRGIKHEVWASCANTLFFYYGGHKGRIYVIDDIYSVCLVKANFIFMYVASPLGWAHLHPPEWLLWQPVVLSSKGVKCCKFVICYIVLMLDCYPLVLVLQARGWSHRGLGWEVSSPWFFSVVFYRLHIWTCFEESLEDFIFYWRFEDELLCILQRYCIVKDHL
jgi:hypothetical protein